MDVFFGTQPIGFGVQVEAAFFGGFILFDFDGMGLGVGVLADAGDLLGDFDVGFVGLDDKMIIFDFFGDDGLGELPDDGELVAEISI